TRRGIVGSAGVVERGKGTGWIAWEPGRSRTRPCACKPAFRVAGLTMTPARKAPPSFRERICETRSAEDRMDPGSEPNKRPDRRGGKSDVGEPDPPGPDRGKRSAVRREPLTGNTGENFESHKPVHETTTGS